MKSIVQILSCLLIGLLFASCAMKLKNESSQNPVAENLVLKNLEDSLRALTNEYPGEIGIALITDRNDTLTINNEAKYPLMSVFKLHQGVSLCRLFEKSGQSLDSVITMYRDSLNPDTWSPMLKDYKEAKFDISIRKLLEYSIQQSDNNASNYLFEKIQPVADVDSYIATLIPCESFKLEVTEKEMWSNHSLCYENRTSPLGAAILIDHLFTDSIMSAQFQDFLKQSLLECKTGVDRIAAPLLDKDGIRLAHKTGSGFRDQNGVLSAHNDVGVIILPDGRRYTLAVFVKDFPGTEEEAARVIAKISSAVYNSIIHKG